MSSLVFTPLAESDLNEILNFVAKDRPETALRMISQIRAKCEFLSNHPHAGESRPDNSALHRCSPVRRWVIFYRVVGDVVEIHRVLDSAQDAASILWH
jgi:toxin ParE1/3/4